MRKEHFLFILGGVVLIGLAFWFFSPSPPPGKVDGRKLVVAAHAYSDQLRKAGGPFPPTVSLDVLIAKGYLRHEDVSGFDGMKVQVYLVARAGQPSVLVEAALPDGHTMQVLNDGSIVEPH